MPIKTSKTKTKLKSAASKERPKKTVQKIAEKAEKNLPILKPEQSKEPEGQQKNQERYFEALGRRKTALARVRLFTRGEKQILVNGKPYEVYFPVPELRQTAIASLQKMNCLDKFGVSVLVRGGGLYAQAEAIRHATARALILFNPDFRKRLRKAGFLTRDSRMRERKKPGLKRARRAPQWQKR